MIDGSEKRNRQLAFEFQNSHVCEKRSKKKFSYFTRKFVTNHRIRVLFFCNLIGKFEFTTTKSYSMICF